MAEQLLYQYLLDSVDITNYILSNSKIEIKTNNINPNEGNLYVAPSVTAVKTPAVGQSIVVSRGTVTATDKVVFRGTVRVLKSTGSNIRLDVADPLSLLKLSSLKKSYDINIDSQAGEYSAIFKDIVEDAGLTSSVVDSGTSSSDVIATKFICRGQTRLNRLQLIARILNWYFYYDYVNDWVRLQPKGNNVFGTTLTVGTNIYNIPIWEEDLEQVRNKITIEGVFSLDTREENETGDGSTATFNFTYVPEGTECTVAGTLVKRGVEGSDETFDYEVDREITPPTYTFQSGSIPTGGQAIVMKYNTKIPTPVTIKSDTSITLYGVTQEGIYSFQDTVTMNDAEVRATQLLSLLKDAPVMTNIITDEYDIEVGDQVTVSDSNNSKYDGNYIVLSRIINYPDPFDTLVVGNDRFQVEELIDTLNERIRALEIGDGGNQELLRSIIDFTKTLNLSRDSSTITRQKICDSFIVGHPINSLIGMGTILDSMNTGSAANWSGTSFTVTDSTDQSILNTDSVKLVWAGGAATGTLTSTQSFGDISAYTGQSSGTPSQGTIGVWLYVSIASDVTSISLKLGSSVSDYTNMTGVGYASVDGYNNWGNLSFSLQAGWNYLLFDLDGGTETGTPDWTACDYASFDIAFAGNTTVYLDYFTVSKSNFIGLNGVGSRKMVIV